MADDSISAAEKQALLAGAKVADKVAEDELRKIKTWVFEGPVGIRVLAFFGGLGVVIISFLHWSAGFVTFSILQIILHAICILLGIITVILEVKENFLTRALRARIVAGAPLLGELAGRGVFYICIGALEFISGSILARIVAIYMGALGIVSIVFAYYSKGRYKLSGGDSGGNDGYVDQNDRDV